MAPVDAVRRRVPTLGGLALALAALACGAPPRGPVETVERYFDVLARDPMRTLALSSPEFHLSHGLAAWRREDGSLSDSGSSPEGSQPPLPRQVEIEDRRVGWINAQIAPHAVERVGELRVRVTGSEVAGDRARVTAEVRPLRGAAFVQRFELARDAGEAGPGAPDAGRWRIVAIEQEGPVGGAWGHLARFAAYPNEALARSLPDRARP